MAGSANQSTDSQHEDTMQHGEKRLPNATILLTTHNLGTYVATNIAFICHTEWSDRRQENDVIDLIRASCPCCRPVFGNPTCDLSNLRFLVCTAFQLCTPFRFTNTPRASVERLQCLRVTARSWQIQQHLWFATCAVRLHRGAPATLSRPSPCACAMKRVTGVLMIAIFSVQQSGSASG